MSENNKFDSNSIWTSKTLSPALNTSININDDSTQSINKATCTSSLSLPSSSRELHPILIQVQQFCRLTTDAKNQPFQILGKSLIQITSGSSTISIVLILGRDNGYQPNPFKGITSTKQNNKISSQSTLWVRFNPITIFRKTCLCL